MIPRMLRLAVCALSVGAMARAAGPSSAPVAPHVHLAGDSTMADKERGTPNPEYGWGERLPLFFRDRTMIVNHATNGRSTKSFRDEGRWDKLLAALRPGDWVIVQFGHNDMKKEDPKRYADARGEFAANLRRFIAEVRAKQAHPVLATSVARRKWSADGTHLVDTHGDYVVVPREIAAAENVPLLELNRLTTALEESFGLENSKQLHLWIGPGIYDRKPAGWQDDTHYSLYGAERVAELAAQEMRRLHLPLADWLVAPRQLAREP